MIESEYDYDMLNSKGQVDMNNSINATVNTYIFIV